MRLAASLGASFDDAEDVAQESLLRFLGRNYAVTAIDERREAALLARIGYSVYLDLLRRKKYRRTEMFVDDRPDGRSHESSDVETARDVATLTARAGLETDDIALLNRRYGDELSIPEIAAELGLHPNTIRRRIDRLLYRLRLAAAADRNAPFLVAERVL